MNEVVDTLKNEFNENIIIGKFNYNIYFRTD